MATGRGGSGSDATPPSGEHAFASPADRAALPNRREGGNPSAGAAGPLRPVSSGAGEGDPGAGPAPGDPVSAAAAGQLPASVASCGPARGRGTGGVARSGRGARVGESVARTRPAPAYPRKNWHRGTGAGG